MGHPRGLVRASRRHSAEWKASTEDEANFIDHKKVAYVVAREHVIVES